MSAYDIVMIHILSLALHNDTLPIVEEEDWIFKLEDTEIPVMFSFNIHL